MRRRAILFLWTWSVMFVFFSLVPAGAHFVYSNVDTDTMTNAWGSAGDTVIVKKNGMVRVQFGNNHPPVLDPIDSKLVERGDSLCFVVTANDPDPEDSIMHYSIEVGDLAGCSDWFAEIDEITGAFCFHMGGHFVPPRPQDMTFQVVFCVDDFSPTPPESLIDCDTVVFTLNEPPFTLEVKKVLAMPGQQHVKVPVFLSNPWDVVGAWELLMEYDPSGGTVVGAELCDWAEVDDEAHGGPDTVYFAPWHDAPDLRPEFFFYQLNANDHPNWLRIIGFQDLAWPQYITPGLPRDEQMLLFCLIFDVSPDWDGHNIVFHFHTKNCSDNTLVDSEGLELWGPHPDSPYPPSAPHWLQCPYDEYVMLLGGHGVGVQLAERGDINCDSIPYSVSDALMFINYLVNGDVALRNGDGVYYCDTFEAHCHAADIDADGECFTIVDLARLIRIINGYEPPVPSVAMAELVVTIVGNAVSVDAEIGVARFVFAGEGEVSGENLWFAHQDGQTMVVACTLEDRPISGHLFTIEGDVKLESVEAASVCGAPMIARISSAPKTYFLSQNYPNPFNVATEIRYTLPADGHVLIDVYNIIGQRVARLVDEDQAAGSHVVTWSDVAVASGIYLCRMEVGGIVLTRKMAFLK